MSLHGVAPVTVAVFFAEVLAEGLDRRMGYLASPYTKLSRARTREAHDAGLDAAAREAAYWTGLFARLGLTAFSPIALSHAAARAETAIDPLDWEFWMGWCAPCAEAAAWCVVPPVLGRDESAGVKAEMAAFAAAGKPVWVLA